MIEFKGKYTTAKVMIDEVEATAQSQIIGFINNHVFTNPVAVMPDVHAGKGAVIGFTMELTNKLIPNVIGVDQSCGVLMARLKGAALKGIDLDILDQAVRRSVPMSNKVHKSPAIDIEKDFDWATLQKDAATFTSEFNKRYGTDFRCPEPSVNWMEALCRQVDVDFDYALNSIGTMGGGNHYIEIGQDEAGHVWISIHSGSRYLGLKTAKFWQNVAIKHVDGKRGKGRNELVRKIKVNFPTDEWGKRIKALPVEPKAPNELSYLEGIDMYRYLIDAIFLYHYSSLSRVTMLQRITPHLGNCPVVELFQTVHNYIDYKDFVIRKGAVSAHAGEIFALPFNQEDGILICEGLGNTEWNCSAPHGAGRLLARNQAKKLLDVEEHRASLKAKGIYSSSLPADELKSAYKDPEAIKQALTPTAKILHTVRPIINFKTKK